MNSTVSSIYDTLYTKSITPSTLESFWQEHCTDISWYTPPSTMLDTSNAPFYKWFPDGRLNLCYNCLDRHIENNNGNINAIIYESCYGLDTRIITYNDLYVQVNKYAKMLLNEGITKGDRVIIYMPMIPESIIAMMACWRIGAIHSVVFGGFAPDELANRINDSQAKMIIISSVGIEPRKKINYFKNVVNAIKIINSSNNSNSSNNCINRSIIAIYQREDVLSITNEEILSFQTETNNSNKIIIINNTINNIDNSCYVKPVELNSNDIVYILYTSGTTNQPKGIVRDVGGCAVTANFTMKYIMNINKGDITFSSSDIGWIVGHLFIVYGPLIRCATTILLEGKPVGTPNCSVCFNIIQKHKVKTFYSCPTAIRAIKLEDPMGVVHINKYDLSSIETVALSGERCDKETFTYLQLIFGKNVMINDHWWQTESGYPICCNNINICRFPCIPGVIGKPMLGFNLKVLNIDTNEEITTPYVEGIICIKLPSPPSFVVTLWNNDEAYVDKYISKDKQYYITSDVGCWDKDGHIQVISRCDDMIKIAGHRISLGRIEEVLMKVNEVSEVAVVAVEDGLKGELPFAFVVCKKEVDVSCKDVDMRIKNAVVNGIGAISRLKGVCYVKALPKNRSGKIMRRILKYIVNGKRFEVPANIEDEKVIEDIKGALKNK